MEKSVQTTILPILFEKRLKPTKNCLEVVSSFVSVSMVKICQIPMHFTNQKSQRWIRNVQTTLIPIFFQKKLKPTSYCLETINSFVSVSMVNIYHNPMHLTNQKSQRWIRSAQTTLIPIFFKKRLKSTKKLLKSSKQFFYCFYGQHLSQSKAFA